MNFNQRNLNPNIWEGPRHNNPQAFINNQQNFYGNNSNFPPRPNFHPQQNQLRPLIGPNEHHSNFRNFNNNNQDFIRNNNNSNRGRSNFHNHNSQPKWQNRGPDNKDSRFNDSTKDNSNNGDRFSREPSAENSQNSQKNDDSKPLSLVEQLKSTMKKNPRSKSQENPANESIGACAKNASKKLLSQLKTMDKDNVKELINNPKQPHRKAVINIQAREKLREEMRKQLKTLGAEDDQEVSFDAVDSVNYENIPETLIAQIGRTVDMDLGVEDMDLQPDMDDDIVEDKDIEVVTKNLGNDFLYGSEMLLMNGFNLLGESENEADLKIPEERLFPPPLPAEPLNRPPEPVPPPEKPPSQRSFDDWDYDTARNPDPPNVKNNNEKIQTIAVIVSHPPPPIQPVPPPSTNLPINNNNNNVLKKQHENPLLISLSEAKEQTPLTTNLSTNIKNSTNPVIGNTSLADHKLVKIHSSSSQDSFKTPSIPDLVTSTPFSNDGSKTPFNDSKSSFNDAGKTPFSDGGKTPFIGSETPFIGSETPFIGSETPFIGSETPFIGSETPFIGSGDDKNVFETPKRLKISDDKKPVIDNTPGSTGSIESDQPKADESTDSKPEQRANETYGEYRRRLANLVEDESSTPKDDFNKPTKRPPPAPKRNQQNMNKEWDDDNRSPANSEKTWISNNRNNSNERKSRFEMNRSRDKNNRNNDRNNFNNLKNNKNNSPRTAPISPWDTSRDKDRDRDREDMRDAFNYRFDNNNSSNNNNTEGGDIDRLSSLLNPKPVQFKGSFNKRSGYTTNKSNSREFIDDRRDFISERSRERTPVNNSVERELFDISSPNDARPCYHTLKKIIEIETEINRIHDKIHGIDKVILNLQTERIGYQKSFTRLQHDKKILLDNLAKRAMANDKDTTADTPAREREKDKEKDEVRPHKEIKKEKDTSTKNKTTEAVAEQKKRKNDDWTQPSILDDDTKKKKKYTIEEEPKSAAQKAKEKEEEERRKRIEEIRRQKQLRREKEEAERRKLEEEAKKESNDKILIINREKVHAKLKEREKEKRKEQILSSSPSPPKPSPKKSPSYLFSSDEVIDPSDVKMKKFKIEFSKLLLNQTILDQYQNGKCPEIDINELSKASSSSTSIRSDKSSDDVIKIIKQEAEQSIKQSKSELPILPSKTSSTSIISMTSVISTEKDPLAMDDNEEIVNPPTPGSNLTLNEDNDTNASDHVNNPVQDYSEWTGNFESHNQPIVHIQNINGKHMVCASEDGKLYKYRLSSGKCDGIFSKHTEICNSFLYEDTDKTIFTASSDGYVYRIKLKLFDSIASKNFNEPLQVIEKSKYALYVGAKSGNIYKLKLDLSDEDIEPLCCVDALILCMRSAKEGSRHILLISSRMNAIQVRDASEGLLLRTLSNDLTGVSIYDMLLEGSTIYCGSNLHEIFAIDFTTGALKKKRSMSGAGAICVRIYKKNLIVACYDGNIYIFDLNADDDACNITGPSNMLLAMDLWDDKIIASTKDKTLKIMNIPT